MYSKAEIYNLALGALLLNRQVLNTETDKSNQVKVLNIHYPVALNTTLSDLNLTSTAVQVTAALVAEDPNDLWLYAYKYPDNCVLFRRLQSPVVKDNPSTFLPKQVGIHEGVKVIFTNQLDAVIEYIPKDVILSHLSAAAGLALAYKLAVLSAPLIVGKGADTLRKSITTMYVVQKAEAQEKDRNENFVYDDPEVESEFVQARLD